MPYRGDTRQSIVTVGCGCNRYQHKPKHPPSQSQPNHTVEYRTLTFVPPPHPATSRHLHMGVRVIAMQMRGCRAYVQATQVSQRGAQIHAQAKKAHSLARMLRAHRHLPTRVITTSRFEYARYCGQNVGGKSQAWVTMVQPSTHTTYLGSQAMSTEPPKERKWQCTVLLCAHTQTASPTHMRINTHCCRSYIGVGRGEPPSGT